MLLDIDGWEGVRLLLDEIWFIDINDELRLERLIARHLRYGRSSAAAEDWAKGTDALEDLHLG